MHIYTASAACPEMLCASWDCCACRNPAHKPIGQVDAGIMLLFVVRLTIPSDADDGRYTQGPNGQPAIIHEEHSRQRSGACRFSALRRRSS